MQDIHSIGGGARLLGGGDRRLRAQGQHHLNNQALKCPRCDSLNTKFCYYNNYNLSQPRHFCKSCRRYWTKGGVLRNVPVGGGCRKTKRSKPKQPPAAAASSPAETASQPQEDVPLNNDNVNNNDKSSNSHSSSESSSLTATNTAATAATAVEAVSSKATTPTTTTNNNNSNVFNGRIEVETSKLFNTNPSLEQAMYEQYPDIGNLTGLMPTSSSENMGFGYGNMMNQQTSSVQVEQQQSMMQGGFDENELRNMQHGSGGGFGGLDWQGNGDQGLFHIPNAVDQAYWTQTQNQWSTTQDHHPGLYLP